MSKQIMVPKLFTVLKEGYSLELFAKDLVAGIIVGIVALPLAIAFAIASGVKPEQGLYTAIIAGFLISAFSGSRVQIGGPTGAFIVIVYDIVQKYGYDGLATATLMAGILLILMGIAQLGSLIKYIPYPVTVGFTSGIALIIFSGQIRDFLGLAMKDMPGGFLEKWIAYGSHFKTMNLYALAIGLLTVALVFGLPKLTHRVPGSLIAILVTTILVQVLNLPVETIGSRFGEIPSSLPAPRLPNLSLTLIGQMASPALTIALLAGIESLLSAVVADGMTQGRHRSNMELVGQGIANIISPIFGGIPATGAIARTATNIKNGGRTPIAGIIHALTLCLIMLAFAKWAALIPMAALAGILIVVAYNMSEWHLFLKLMRAPRGDILVLMLTFLLTVFVDLTVAIQVGVVLASLLFMQRMAAMTEARFVTEWFDDDAIEDSPIKGDGTTSGIGRDREIIPAGVEVFEVSGPFFFGATEKFRSALIRVARNPKVLILRLRQVMFLDATALRALEELLDQTKKKGTRLILSGVQNQPMETLRKAKLLDRIGVENIADNIVQAIEIARQLVDTP